MVGKIFYAATLVLPGLIFAGCTSHKIDSTHKVELEVKPMHITIDVNVRVDKALDDFFGDLDDKDNTMREVDQ
ncbi:MAG: hypothetical protein JW808_00705 [Victivallales bacterium]|nr:hypothetical protein [Victivallales bacterium]